MNNTWNRTLITLLLLATSLWAVDIPIDNVKKRTFSENISLNSKIVQLSSSKSLVMAEMGGKITKYLVKEGDRVKKGQVVAWISVIAPLELTINIAPLKAELRELKKQLNLANRNYDMVRKLYNRGLESRQNLNKQEEESGYIISQIEVIKAKLASLDKGKKTSQNSYDIYAGSSGRVDKVLVSPHAVVDANTPLLSIVKGEESFLVKSYIPLSYLNQIRIGLKGTLFYGGKSYTMHLTQILPALDEKTQQMVVLSTIDVAVKNLLVNAYVDSELSLGLEKKYLSIKKTALSFFNNEWVVFVPEHHEEKEHDEEEHEKHEDEAKHHEEHKHEKHGHGHEHEAKEVPYGIRVVKVIKQNKNFVAIEGLREHDEYVSEKSYYVKSLLLKSALGGHGH